KNRISLGVHTRLSRGVGVVDLFRQRGEVPSQLGGSRYNTQIHTPQGLSQPFVPAESPDLVLADGPPRRNPKLVLTERRAVGGEEVAGVEHVVAQELPGVSVQLIGSAARGDRNVCPWSTAISPVGDVTLDIEFLDGVRRRAYSYEVEEQLVV